jgi:hypothetical protein
LTCRPLKEPPCMPAQTSTMPSEGRPTFCHTAP